MSNEERESTYTEISDSSHEAYWHIHEGLLFPLLKKYTLHLAYIWILSKNGCGSIHFGWFKDEDAQIVNTI
jgi:hypothetical protein